MSNETHATSNPDNFQQWWDEHYADIPDDTANRAFGEEVWNDATKRVWLRVFNVISDMAYRNDRETIVLLERWRDKDHCGPFTGEDAGDMSKKQPV